MARTSTHANKRWGLALSAGTYLAPRRVVIAGDVKRMSEQVAQTFIDGLHQLEENRELEAIVATYADNSVVGNIVSPEQFEGREGAREFWTKYREAFGTVHSEFRNIITTDDAAALEWTTTGTNIEGEPFQYDGVSLLEIEDGLITRFRAYFNPSDLGKQIVKPIVATTAGPANE